MVEGLLCRTPKGARVGVHVLGVSECVDRETYDLFCITRSSLEIDSLLICSRAWCLTMKERRKLHS